MRKFLFIAVLLFAGAMQAKDVALPDALPANPNEESPGVAVRPRSAPMRMDAGKDNADDVSPGKDVQGIVMPNPVPLASNDKKSSRKNKNTVFDFPAIADTKPEVPATVTATTADASADAEDDDNPAASATAASKKSMPAVHVKAVVAAPLKPSAAPAAHYAQYRPHDDSEKTWVEEIRAALQAKSAGSQIAIEGVRYGHLISEARENPWLWHIQNISFDDKNGRFTGTLSAPGHEAVPFNGRYGALQMVPVLCNRLTRGDTIKLTDIELQPVMSSRLRAGNAILDPNELVGKTLRHAIALGTPLRPYDLTLPTVVTPNTEVNMVYSGESLQLSDRGIALEKGAVGDIIRVKNSKSGAELRARVESANTVTVNYFNSTAKSGDHYAAN